MSVSCAEDLVPTVAAPRNDSAEPFRGRVSSVASSGYDSSLSTSPDRGATAPSSTSTTATSLTDQFLVWVNKYAGDGGTASEFDGVDSPRRLYNRRGSLEGERAVRAATSRNEIDFGGERDYERLYEYLRLVKSNLEQGLWAGHPPVLGGPTHRSECIFHHARPAGCANGPLAQNWSTRMTERTYEECLFCKTRGLDAAMYRSHTMRCPMTRNIICPLLTANICRICGDRGDHRVVHLDTDCTSQLRRVGSGRFLHRHP